MGHPMLEFTAWHCVHEVHEADGSYPKNPLMCPEEGCPHSYGCARDHGWKSGDPSPPECRGLKPDTAAAKVEA